MTRRDKGAITIETAATAEAFATGRALIGEYADWLGVDLCFQGYDEELANLESVYTYEGTHDVHSLVLGQTLTGINAF